jgi:hypothetical protein
MEAENPDRGCLILSTNEYAPQGPQSAVLAMCRACDFCEGVALCLAVRTSVRACCQHGLAPIVHRS